MSESVGKYNFLPDYNARYTVLAGDSYLDEASDILYDTTPGASQSLAVTTATVSPYETDTLFSLFPGGGYTLGSASDTHMSTSISSEGSSLTLTTYDSVSRMHIAGVRYDIRGLETHLCSGDTLEDARCSSDMKPGQIALVSKKNTTGITFLESSTSLGIKKSANTLFSYSSTSGISLSSGVRLLPIDRLSSGYLVLSLDDHGTEIARLLISLPRDT